MEYGFTAEQVKKIAPNYRGDFKKFDPSRDKSKLGKQTLKDITGKPPPTPQAKPVQKLDELPPPRNLEAAKKPTPQRNHDMLAEAIYAPRVQIAETKPRENFDANFSMLPRISGQVYQELAKDANQLHRVFTKEELNYYATGLLWFRLLDIKRKSNRQILTAAEKDIIRTTEDDVYTVPAPIYAYLQSIGNVKDAMGKLTYLNIPPLPTAEAQGQGGYHATEITTATHTLYSRKYLAWE